MTWLIGGRTVFGQAVGVLTLETTFPRPPGDIGNATTWPFPVRYRVVAGATSRSVIQRPTAVLRDAFVAGVQDLEEAGVALITTSCGFLALYQREQSEAVSVPVLTYALLQVPLARHVIPRDRRVAILTISEADLTDGHFQGVRWSRARVPAIVRGFGPGTEFATFGASP